MPSGLHARKKTLNHDEDVDPEIPKSPSNGGTAKTHRRTSLLRRYVRSEIGCAIEVVFGFLLFGIFLGYLILHHQQRKVILHIMHDPLGHIGHGVALKGRSGFRHHYYTGHPRSVTVVMPSVVNPNRRTQRLDSILETWGGSARAVYVVHNVSEYPEASHAVLSENHKPEDPYSYPQLMLVPSLIGLEDGVERLLYVIRMVYEKINPDFAFFINDHTFVIPEHLCEYLEHKNPNNHIYHGHALKNDKSVFNSGAAGYILSRETMKGLVDKLDHDDPLCTGKEAVKWLQGNPGLLTSECMKKFGVTPVDTRHHEIYHRFHAFPLTRMVSGDIDQWYINKHIGMDELMEGLKPSYNTLLSGADCCSQDTISFHYVEYMESRALFATREALLKNPHMTDHELKNVMVAEWPRQQKDVGGYSRGLPKESDDEGWEPLLKVMRNISSRHTQREC